MFLGVVGAGVIGLDATGEAVAVPLLATQILWINLLTDTAPALAMGVDPPPDDVMARPPRRLTDRVIDRRDAGRHRLRRAGHGARHAARPRPPAAGRARRAASATSSRPARWRSPPWCSPSCSTASTPAPTASAPSTTCSPTRCCGRAIALSLLLQVAVVHVPFLNDAFDTTPLSRRRLAALRGLASMVLWADEAQEAGRATARAAEPRSGFRPGPDDQDRRLAAVRDVPRDTAEERPRQARPAT